MTEGRSVENVPDGVWPKRRSRRVYRFDVGSKLRPWRRSRVRRGHGSISEAKAVLDLAVGVRVGRPIHCRSDCSYVGCVHACDGDAGAGLGDGDGGAERGRYGMRSRPKGHLPPLGSGLRYGTVDGRGDEPPGGRGGRDDFPKRKP